MEQQPTPSAVHRVLALPELLEQILLHLSLITIIASATRVNRKWRTLIATSPVIRQKLFLKPNKPVINPATSSPLKCSGPFYHRHLSLNPILKSSIITWSNAGEATPRFDAPVQQKIIVSGWRGEQRASELHQSVHEPEANWRSMFATDPPCSEVEVEMQQVREEESESYETERWMTVRCEEGVKLGMLEDAAVGMIGEWRDNAGVEVGDRAVEVDGGEVSSYFKFHMLASDFQGGYSVLRSTYCGRRRSL